MQRTAHTNHRGITLLLLGMLGLTAIAGYLAGNDRRLIMTALFGIVPALIITLYQFERMVLLIPAAALLITFSLPTGTESRLSVVMLLVMLLTGIWIVTFLTQRRAVWHRSLLNAPMLSFIAICTLSLLWSVAFRDPMVSVNSKFIIVQLGALATMVLSPVASLLIGNFVHTPRQIWWIAGMFVAVGIVTTIFGLGGRELSILNTRGLFSLWFVAVVFGLIIAQPMHLLLRLGLAVLLALHLYLIFIVGILWLSGWFPAIVAIVAITLFRSRLAFLGLAIVLAIGIAASWGFLYKNIFEHSEAEGDFERLTLLQLNLELVQNHPLLGTGPAGYAVYYMTYHPQEARSTHNNYLDIIAQMGLLGTACWLWLVVAGLREGYAALRHAPPGSYRTLALITCGGLVGAVSAMTLGDWVLPFAYNQGIVGYSYTVFSWIFLGVLMSIRRQVAPLPEHPQPTPRRSGYRRDIQPT